MHRMPCLLPKTKQPDGTDSVVFAVFAPLGTDSVLSTYPDGKRKAIRRQPIVKHLVGVARQGVHVCALIDLLDDDSYLVEIPAFEPQHLTIYSAWKQRMNAPQALAGFLRRVHQRFPCSAVVLALEGHGTGYLPELEAAVASPQHTSQGPGGAEVEWRVRREGVEPVDATTGAPVLAVIPSPELPVESPEARPFTLPLSTWALGQALRSAIRDRVPRPAVLHFNNCFNMSVEVLHTVAPFADFASGYANYNFYTAGETYPAVFKRLRRQFERSGPVPAEQLAQWFAQENGALLGAMKNHPSVGATIALRRLTGVRSALDRLGKELFDALRAPGGAAVRASVKTAVLAAQQYDTEQGFQLQVPDQLTDLADFAAQLKLQFPAGTIHDRADDLARAVGQIWQYGDFDRPHMDETQIWDFRSKRLGLNVLFPDPGLDGLWDWRSPYYLKNNNLPATPPAQPHVIDFLADASGRTPWVKFLIEYHVGSPRIRLLRAKPPLFPVFDRTFKPKYPHPTDQDVRPPPPPPHDPGQHRGKRDDGTA